MTDPTAALDALKRYFGYESFRPGQTAVVNALLGGRDVLAVMPTGAGKSVCYQIPAVLLPGVTVVISPLISLMQDQVDALNDIGLPAAFINGTQAPDEQSMVLAQAAAGRVKLLYVAPERLETQRFRNFASSTPISLVAVDEAHCVSQWGQDFRSSYLSIGEFIASLPRRPIVGAFTATATEKVRYDVVNLLGLRSPQVTVTGFDRPNLYFDVIMMEGKRKAAWIADYIAAHAQESGIVYCSTRKETEALADTLNRAVPAKLGGAAGGVASAGRLAVAYHGGMSADVRAAAQRDFVTDRVQVVVATNAFGMGIDKSNVRYVIHHNMPESIEAYYQEAGRAGRDGEPSRCTLLWNESDIVTRRRLLDNDNENERMTPEEQEIARRNRRRLLDGMIGYCRTTECLHRYMTRYFGQEDGPVAGANDGVSASGKPVKCGACANCERTFTTIDVSAVARAISQCVHDVDQRVGSGKIVRILRGSQAQDLAWLNPQSMPTFGMLKDVPEARIRDVLSQMATDGFLYIDAGRLPIVKFGRRAAETVAPGFHYEIKRVDRKTDRSSDGIGGAGRPVRRVASGIGGAGTPDSTVYGASGTSGSADVDAYVPNDEEDALFERLRALRRTIAQEIGKPPYIVFSDRTLRDMARIRPVTDAQFLAVNGVGERKLGQYGKRFMEEIAAFNAAKC
ncbi:ATP-dependent DNA helicase RecQ [Bifidobacterium sp. UTCIF-37]|uniref:RecQ family ATP-dependent DNA helicase n=1 Tax=unclassified Bifidobacterium TaxID=2608897 RepID=UPI00112AD160|nr:MULTISPECIES: RecQ family ATP-dependent DNA helicase [unclassified Bifidobacterium]TPF86238.1 ATP-dependent DNA helicase RecQ [Bifidobacterium sp. UTCIF-37]TPF88557.1 ATP-dependent DNA helicase RecQ [Bifidobacterium sp. UTCIF-38]